METLSYCQLMQRCGELEAENAVLIDLARKFADRADDYKGSLMGFSVFESFNELKSAGSKESTSSAIAALRAEGVDIARNALIAFVEDDVGPNENVPGLIRGAELCVSIARQLRESKGANHA